MWKTVYVVIIQTFAFDFCFMRWRKLFSGKLFPVSFAPNNNIMRLLFIHSIHNIFSLMIGYYFNDTGLLVCEPFYGKPSYRILATCSLYFPTTMILMYCYGSSFHASRFRLVVATPSALLHQHSLLMSQATTPTATTTITGPTTVAGTTTLPSTSEKVHSFIPFNSSN